MNAIEILKSRYACKHYDSSRDVSDEAFSRILEAGRLTPSAMNVQPWHIYVFDRASKDKIRPAILDFNLERFDGCSKAVLISSRSEVSDAYLSEVTAREEEDGRYAGAPEIKGTVHNARKAYVAKFKGEKLTEWTGPAKVDELLGLAGRKETAQLVVLFGYRKDDGNADRPKSRLPLDRIVTKL